MFGDRRHPSSSHKSLVSKSIKQRKVGLRYKGWEMVLQPQREARPKQTHWMSQWEKSLKPILFCAPGDEEATFQVRD